MNYKAFQEIDRALHIAFHEAKKAGSATVAIDTEWDLLHHVHTREYQISDRMTIKVFVMRHAISVSARRTDRGLNLVGGELDMFSAAELRTTAELRAMVQQYEDGKLEELPPSGIWQGQACRRYQRMGCDTNAWGETVDPESCYVCGAMEAQHASCKHPNLWQEPLNAEGERRCRDCGIVR